MELEYEVVNGKPEKWWALKDLNLRPIGDGLNSVHHHIKA